MAVPVDSRALVGTVAMDRWRPVVVPAVTVAMVVPVVRAAAHHLESTEMVVLVRMPEHRGTAVTGEPVRSPR